MQRPSRTGARGRGRWPCNSLSGARRPLRLRPSPWPSWDHSTAARSPMGRVVRHPYQRLAGPELLSGPPVPKRG
eukprot:6659652-Lingulodinium_polyedra.AAC.1